MRTLSSFALGFTLAACAAPKDASRHGADSARPAGPGETTGVSARPEPMPTATGARDTTAPMPAARGDRKKSEPMPGASRDSVPPPSRDKAATDTAKQGGGARGPKPPSRVIPDPVLPPPPLRDSATRPPEQP
jgi:hypothetical protein